MDEDDVLGIELREQIDAEDFDDDEDEEEEDEE